MDLFMADKPSVLLVDHTPVDLSLARTLLEDVCKVSAMRHEDQGLTHKRPQPMADLILLSEDLPNPPGHAVCRQFRSNPLTAQIPIILMSDNGSAEDEKAGFACGASDYIVRPFQPELFVARIKAHLANKANVDLVRAINIQLEREITRGRRELTTVQEVVISSLTALAQARDAETGKHLTRTQHFVHALSLALQTHPRFSAFLTPGNIQALFQLAPMHDIGKVGIPDRILLKPGRFDADEMAIMKTHTTLGRDVIEHAEMLLGNRIGFLTIAKEVAFGHHEKWDGSGYPQGIAGDAIPISARIMALADVYDALTGRRIYKAGLTHTEATALILAGKGKHFDPDIVDAFMAIRDQFQAISAQYGDSDNDMQEKAQYCAVATNNMAPQ
jgi:putative two-component system response regulator